MFILRLVLWSGWDKKKVNPKHREEDTERGQLLKVGHRDAVPPAA